MRWIGVGVAVAALAFAAAGCGGSSDSGSEATADTVVTNTSASTDTSASTEETSTETTSTDTGDLSGLSGECNDLAGASQQFAAAIASSTSGGNSDAEATADAFKAFAEQAPDELKDDFEVLGEVIAAYAVALKDLDLEPGAVPTADQIAKLTQLGQSLSTTEAQQASAAIAAWGEEHCGSTP